MTLDEIIKQQQDEYDEWKKSSSAVPNVTPVVTAKEEPKPFVPSTGINLDEELAQIAKDKRLLRMPVNPKNEEAVALEKKLKDEEMADAEENYILETKDMKVRPEFSSYLMKQKQINQDKKDKELAKLEAASFARLPGYVNKPEDIKPTGLEARYAISPKDTMLDYALTPAGKSVVEKQKDFENKVRLDLFNDVVPSSVPVSKQKAADIDEKYQDLYDKEIALKHGVFDAKEKQIVKKYDDMLASSPPISKQMLEDRKTRDIVANEENRKKVISDIDQRYINRGNYELFVAREVADPKLDTRDARRDARIDRATKAAESIHADELKNLSPEAKADFIKKRLPGYLAQIPKEDVVGVDASSSIDSLNNIDIDTLKEASNAKVAAYKQSKAYAEMSQENRSATGIRYGKWLNKNINSITDNAKIRFLQENGKDIDGMSSSEKDWFIKTNYPKYLKLMYDNALQEVKDRRVDAHTESPYMKPYDEATDKKLVDIERKPKQDLEKVYAPEAPEFGVPTDQEVAKIKEIAPGFDLGAALAKFPWGDIANTFAKLAAVGGDTLRGAYDNPTLNKIIERELTQKREESAKELANRKLSLTEVASMAKVASKAELDDSDSATSKEMREAYIRKYGEDKAGDVEGMSYNQIMKIIFPATKGEEQAALGNVNKIESEKREASQRANEAETELSLALPVDATGKKIVSPEFIKKFRVMFDEKETDKRLYNGISKEYTPEQRKDINIAREFAIKDIANYVSMLTGKKSEGQGALAKILRGLNAYIRQTTGASMTEQEAQRIVTDYLQGSTTLEDFYNKVNSKLFSYINEVLPNMAKDVKAAYKPNSTDTKWIYTKGKVTRE